MHGSKKVVRMVPLSLESILSLLQILKFMHTPALQLCTPTLHADVRLPSKMYYTAVKIMG